MKNNAIQTSLVDHPSDNEFIGEIVPSTKHINTTRLYFININGISPYHQYKQFKQVLDNLINMQVDIICLAEHNLAVDQSNARFELIKTIQKHLPNSRIITTTSTIEFHTPFQPGGCLQIFSRTIHSRITTQGSDKLG